ncbi:hypothetical protein, partial [Mycobacterium tuberculosis]|uniref:hypothetical protein n=1 Tax=Mycobacterium tuberculosis TaxID=1773 RepID=UPI001BE06516
RACGVKVETLDDEIELYKGYKVVTLSPNEMSHLYSHTKDNPFDLRINEYLIIKDETRPLLDGEGDGKDEYQTVDILRWDGNDLVQLRQPPKKVVKAENDLQRCAIDLLYNKQIPIKVIAGTYGSGKSFLATKMGL